MKALEKDRTRRYDTAKDFADDVQHYLNDQPVEARAPSTLYRFQKFVRRYRAATATIAVIAATLIAATVFSTWMAVREVRAREANAGCERSDADQERQSRRGRGRESPQGGGRRRIVAGGHWRGSRGRRRQATPEPRSNGLGNAPTIGKPTGHESGPELPV